MALAVLLVELLNYLIEFVPLWNGSKPNMFKKLVKEGSCMLKVNTLQVNYYSHWRFQLSLDMYDLCRRSDAIDRKIN